MILRVRVVTYHPSTLPIVPSSPPPNVGPAPLSPASSFLSEGDSFEPPTKRRRVSFSESSLSDTDSSSSEDEEERPLAAKRAEKSRGGRGKGGGPRQQRTGGKGMKSKAQTAPAHIPPPTDAERAEMAPQPANGANGHQVIVKVEDKMDESQLTRLATGVTVDAAGVTSANVRFLFIHPCCCLWVSCSLLLKLKNQLMSSCGRALFASCLSRMMESHDLWSS